LRHTLEAGVTLAWIDFHFEKGCMDERSEQHVKELLSVQETANIKASI
jgi:hypothetical protein